MECKGITNTDCVVCLNSGWI